MKARQEKGKSGSRELRRGLLQVRVTEKEKEVFEQAANLSGLALSAWMRERLRTVARQELEATGKRVQFH
jgi:hypothetical protein